MVISTQKNNKTSKKVRIHQNWSWFFTSTQKECARSFKKIIIIQIKGKQNSNIEIKYH